MIDDDTRLVVYSGERPALIDGIWWEPGKPLRLSALAASRMVGKNGLRYRLASLTGPCKTCGNNREERQTE